MNADQDVELFGVRIHALHQAELIPAVARLLVAKKRSTVSYVNVHVLNEARKNERLRQFLNATDLCYCDGNGVRLGARISGQALPARMTGADLIWDLASFAAGTWRIFWIGGRLGVAARAARELVKRNPGLEIDVDHGYHSRSGPSDRACIDRINSFRPDIVLVGMGTPLQELWVSERRSQIDAQLVWCLGATADFVAGEVARGPRWLTDHAEWISRLFVEPRRLWRRYLIGNPLFLARVAVERVRRDRSGRGV